MKISLSTTSYATLLVLCAAAGMGCGAPDASGDPDLSSQSVAPPEAFSYDPLDAVLGEYVNDEGFVDYAALKQESDDLLRFNASLGAVTGEELSSWTDAEQLAFWINAYNSITLEYILQHYPIEPSGIVSRVRFPDNSIRQIPGVWDKKTMTVAGRELTLDQIEHDILRKDFNEPRIHVAINCASIGCPPLREEAFVAEKLEQQLAEQSRRFLANESKFRIDRDANAVRLSPIFNWFGDDFAGVYNEDGAITGHGKVKNATLAFAARYVPEDDADYLRNAEYTVSYSDYDWSLNDQNRDG